MAKNGYKIFDSDTHVGPQADILERYMSAGDLDRLKEFEGFLRKNDKTGHSTYNFNTRKYARRLGEPEARESDASEYMTGLTAQHRQPPNPLLEDDPAERIKHRDLEGGAVQLRARSCRSATCRTRSYSRSRRRAGAPRQSQAGTTCTSPSSQALKLTTP